MGMGNNMKHILAVDDEVKNLLLVKQALEGEYELTGVTSGEEALEVLERQIPDLLLLDIEMPGRNGLEIARLIRKDERLKEIPIVFLTGEADSQMEAECLQMGADDFIIKPFVPLVMTRRIGRILELLDLRRTLEEQLRQKTKQIEAVTRMSVTDTLTGLSNRSYLEKRIVELIGEEHEGTLFIMDMDNFKKVNDTFGHIAGDKSLQLLADVLRENTRKQDVIGRLGGDEFVVFFVDMTDREVAVEKAKNIQNMFLERFRSSYNLGDVSISMGIVNCPEDGRDFKTLYNNGDKALYYIKNNGKSSYHFFDENRQQATEVYNTTVDLDNVRDLIEGKLDTTRGAFQVAYEEFQKIYDFIMRCVARKQQLVQTVLLTLNIMDDNEYELEDMERAMTVLQDAIKDSLRAVDVGTQYSSRQYILILMDADTANGIKVVERVRARFYQMYTPDKITVSYDIRAMYPEVK